MKRIVFLACFLLIFLCACGNSITTTTTKAANKSSKGSSSRSTEEVFYSTTEDAKVFRTEEFTSCGAIGTLDDLEEQEETTDRSETKMTSSEVVTTTLAPEETDFTNAEGAVKKLTWEEFQNLAPEAQDAYLESYQDYEAFFNWMMDAQAKAAETSTEGYIIGYDGIIEANPTK